MMYLQLQLMLKLRNNKQGIHNLGAVLASIMHLMSSLWYFDTKGNYTNYWF